MAWSFPKTLKRTGGPALGVFISKSAFDIVRKGPDSSTVEIVKSNALLLAAVWLCVAGVMFAVVGLLPRLRKRA